MIIDYNESIQREIDYSYKQGKLDGIIKAHNIVRMIKEQMLNSIETQEKDLHIINAIDSSLTNLLKNNSIG